MQIYIGNLSAKINSLDLAQFLSGYGDYPSFKFKYYQKEGKRFYYALTSIVPDSRARLAVTRRNMKRLKGRPIVFRAYKDRVLLNERRALDWRSKRWESEECRIVDRRHVQHDKNSNDTMRYVEPVPVLSHFW